MTYTPTGDSEEFESENLEAIHQKNLEEMAALEQTPTVEDASMTDEDPETDSKTFQDRRDARKGDASKNNDLFKVDRPGMPLMGPGASTKFARDLHEVTSAPAQGVVDTITDTFNFATGAIRKPFNIPEVPKVGKYESDIATALRSIS